MLCYARVQGPLALVVLFIVYYDTSAVDEDVTAIMTPSPPGPEAQPPVKETTSYGKVTHLPQM